MSKKLALSAGLAALALALLAGGAVSWAWSRRDTPASRRAARKATAGALRACAPEAVRPFLERLASETALRTWFAPAADGSTSPWRVWTLRAGFLTAVPFDAIGQFTEDQFIRFAGDGGAKPPDAARLRELLDFSRHLLARDVLSEAAANALRERRLDGFFLSGDFDGAIACLEGEGVPSRSPGWCRGTAAKLRAHKAMEAGDAREALRQFRAFGAFMLSDEQKDFEDCDPTTGIVYSRDWIVARNDVRCAKLAREIGDAAQADACLADARTRFAAAHEKAKDDRKSLDALRAEMKDAGCALPALPAEAK